LRRVEGIGTEIDDGNLALVKDDGGLRSSINGGGTPTLDRIAMSCEGDIGAGVMTTSVTLELAVLPLPPLAAGVEDSVGDDEVVGVVAPLVLLLPVVAETAFEDCLAAITPAGKFNLILEPPEFDDGVVGRCNPTIFSFWFLGLRLLKALVDPVRDGVGTYENGSDVDVDPIAGTCGLVVLRSDPEVTWPPPPDKFNLSKGPPRCGEWPLEIGLTVYLLNWGVVFVVVVVGVVPWGVVGTLEIAPPPPPPLELCPPPESPTNPLLDPANNEKINGDEPSTAGVGIPLVAAKCNHGFEFDPLIPFPPETTLGEIIRNLPPDDTDVESPV
jgi:hypothetical protein